MLAYPTSLEQDIEILEDDDKTHKLSYNERNCILLRRNDKIILKSLEETSNAILDLGKLTRREAVVALMKNRKSFKTNMKYVQNVFIPLLPETIEDSEVK